MEEYRTIPGFSDYQVSNLGNVKSFRRKTPIVMRPQKWTTGYRMVSLRCDGDNDYHLRLVHVLVMLAFVGPKPEGQCIRHLDGNPSNNQLSNLVYGTMADNQRDRIDHGTYGMKLTVRKVRVIRGLHKCGFTCKRLSEIFSVNRNTISRVCRRQTWTKVD